MLLIFIETKYNSVTSHSDVIMCKSTDSIFRKIQEIQTQDFPELPLHRFCFALNLNLKCISLTEDLFQLKYLLLCCPFFKENFCGSISQSSLD